LARVLIVGCGCRGQALATALLERGYAVRGTTRSPDRVAAIEATGAEAALADPDRLGTVMEALVGVSAICWLMASATGEAVADLHGPRLRTLLERLVDTPVRGVVYEAAGTVEGSLLAAGAQAVRDAERTWRMPAAITDTDPADREAWLAAMAAAVGRLLGAID
jgi:uncharacterized protein YbjT (DUF2867 family)